MSTVLTRPTNGVSFGYKHTITAQDATDNAVIIDFQVDYYINAVIQVIDDSDVHVELVDAVITYPAAGQVSIADGGATFVLTEDHVLQVIAQRARPLA